MFKKKNIGRSNVVVIGASRLGARIASEKSAGGIYTSIIDIDPTAFRKLDESFSGYSIVGDAEDASILEKAHIEEATEVDIMTDEDNVNILLAFICSEIYHVPMVIVRLRDEKKAELLEPYPGIHVIAPAQLSLQAYDVLHEQQGKKSDKDEEEK